VIFVAISISAIDVKPVNSTPPIAGAWISIIPSRITIGQVGQPLPTPVSTLNVTFSNVTNLFAWQVKVYYDQSVISFENADAAVDPDPSINIFGNRSHYWAPSLIKTDVGTNNHYLMAGSTLTPPETGVNGSGVLCQLNFKGVNPGRAFLNFSRPYGVDTLMLNMTQAATFNPQPIPAHLVDGSVTVLSPYDTIPPKIETPTRTPEGDILPDQATNVTVNVTDNQTGVKNVTLSYTTNNGITWTSISMTYNSSSDLYQATIPGQQAGTSLKYSISAYDNAGNYAKSDDAGSYLVDIAVPKSPPSLVLLLLIIVTLIAVIVIVMVFRRTRASQKT
jgi:hypothetical protein